MKRPVRLRGRVVFLWTPWTRSLLACALAWSLSGCQSGREAVAPPRAQKEIRSSEVRQIATESLFGGPEICFNGLDDNGNSLIDEGCGIHQSPVQFVAAWEESGVDVDLHVTDPHGEVARADGTTELGLTLSADCPGDEKGCHGQDYESVYLEDADAAPGNYLVRLRLEKMPPNVDSVQVSLGVRLPSGTEAYRVDFFDAGQDVQLKFMVSEESSGKSDAESKKGSASPPVASVEKKE